LSCLPYSQARLFFTPYLVSHLLTQHSI
jgi:hypothetical protein